MTKRPTNNHSRMRPGQRLGKYKIRKRLSEGPYATVYAAQDSIEGIPVALKLPHSHLMTEAFLDEFRREVRLTTRLDHAFIIRIKNADFIDDRFVIAYPLGDQTLADRIRFRMSFKTALELIEQALEAVAYAHQNNVIHCDIKPENFILFKQHHIRLTDFGIAKVARRTIKASGSGTVGYLAPEQAMGRPSTRSDVFSLGLTMYRVFSGKLPHWPFDWPPVGIQNLRRRAHPDLVNVVRKAMEVRPTKRYRDAGTLLAAFQKVKRKAVLFSSRRSTATATRTTTKRSSRRR